MTPTLDLLRIELHRDHSHPETARWTAVDGRFVIVRNPGRRGEPASYDITDTTRTDWVNYPGQGNVVRVYETADIRPMIAKALRNTPRRGRSTR